MPYNHIEKFLLKISKLHKNPEPLSFDIGIDIDKLFHLAMSSSVLPYIFYRLDSNPEFGKIIKKYDQSYRRERMLSSAVHMEFEFLRSNLTNHEIPFIPLKGALLSSLLYPDKALRSMMDIDILVRYEDADKLRRILREMNYFQDYESCAFKREILPRINGSAVKNHIEDIKFKREHSFLEIHFKLLSSKISKQLSNSSLWERALNIMLEGKEMTVLCPEHQVINLATHVSQHNFGFGLRAISEIDAVISYYKKDLDWDNFIEETQKYNLEGLIYAPLLLSCSFYESSIPSHVLSALKATCSRTIFNLAEKLKSDFFNRFSIKLLRDNSLFLQIFSQKGKLRSFKNLFFPAPSVLLLYEEEGKKGFLFLLGCYILRSFHLIINYLPRILSGFSRSLKLIYGKNNQI